MQELIRTRHKSKCIRIKTDGKNVDIYENNTLMEHSYMEYNRKWNYDKFVGYVIAQEISIIRTNKENSSVYLNDRRIYN